MCGLTARARTYSLRRCNNMRYNNIIFMASPLYRRRPRDSLVNEKKYTRRRIENGKPKRVGRRHYHRKHGHVKHCNDCIAYTRHLCAYYQYQLL